MHFVYEVELVFKVILGLIYNKKITNMTDKSDREKSEKSNASNQVKHVPKDAQVIVAILKDMGVTDYEPRVINQMLEFTYRYVTCILDDARVYANHSNHANKKSIDLKDEKLAVQMISERAFTTPLPRETLIEMARSKNNTPLPLVKPHCGLRLPPDRYCLSSCNFKLRPNIVNNKKTKSNADSRNISKLSAKSATSAAALKRQSGQTALPTLAKTQTVTVPKPVFKFSTSSPAAKPKLQQVTKMDIENSEPISGSALGVKRKREDDMEIVV